MSYRGYFAPANFIYRLWDAIQQRWIVVIVTKCCQNVSNLSIFFRRQEDNARMGKWLDWIDKRNYNGGFSNWSKVQPCCSERIYKIYNWTSTIMQSLWQSAVTFQKGKTIPRTRQTTFLQHLQRKNHGLVILLMGAWIRQQNNNDSYNKTHLIF